MTPGLILLSLTFVEGYEDRIVDRVAYAFDGIVVPFGMDAVGQEHDGDPTLEIQTKRSPGKPGMKERQIAGMVAEMADAMVAELPSQGTTKVESVGIG